MRLGFYIAVMALLALGGLALNLYAWVMTYGLWNTILISIAGIAAYGLVFWWGSKWS